jgi:hypothetical protein
MAETYNFSTAKCSVWITGSGMTLNHPLPEMRLSKPSDGEQNTHRVAIFLTDARLRTGSLAGLLHLVL